MGMQENLWPSGNGAAGNQNLPEKTGDFQGAAAGYLQGIKIWERRRYVSHDNILGRNSENKGSIG